MFRLSPIILLILTSCYPNFEKNDEYGSRHSYDVISQTDSLLEISDEIILHKSSKERYEQFVLDSLKELIDHTKHDHGYYILGLEDKIVELEKTIKSKNQVIDQIKYLYKTDSDQYKHQIDKLNAKLENQPTITVIQTVHDTVYIIQQDTLYIPLKKKNKNN